MKELLELIIKNVVDDDNFVVEEISEEDRVTLIIKVPQEKLGLIIGKEGRTIKAIQDLIRIKATLLKKFVSLKAEALDLPKSA